MEGWARRTPSFPATSTCQSCLYSVLVFISWAWRKFVRSLLYKHGDPSKISNTYEKIHVWWSMHVEGGVPEVSGACARWLVLWNWRIPGSVRDRVSKIRWSSREENIQHCARIGREWRTCELWPFLYSGPVPLPARESNVCFPREVDFFPFSLIVLFWGRVLLCSPGWHIINSNPPALDLQVLGLQMCARSRVFPKISRLHGVESTLNWGIDFMLFWFL